MADFKANYRPAPSHEIKAHARSLAYLGTVDKIMAALANEYGSDRPLPSRAYIQEVLERRAAGVSMRSYLIGAAA